MTEQNNSALDDILTSERLPSPSGVALQILELTRDVNASVEDLKRVLVADPALSGQILKYANSALARGNTEVAAVGEAVVRLGMSTVQHLALGFSLLSAARRAPARASTTTASGRARSPRAWRPRTWPRWCAGPRPDEAFTCGLLGRHRPALALASVHPRDYASVLARWDGVDEGLRDLEHEILLIDHDEVTAA